MSYDEEQHKRSRVVVETPTARREVVHSQTVRYPEERRGYSTGVIAAVALTAIAATVIIMLFVTNPSDDSESTTINANLRAAAPAQTPFQQTPVIVQTPMTQPTPIIIQQAPATAPPPQIIVAPPPTSTEPSTAAPPSSTSAPPASSGTSASDDLSLQQRVDKLFDGDREVAAANIFATVINGRVQLTGTVSTEAVKQRAERLASSVKGVLGVDNRITIAP
jgi:hypothetical protein